jgi:SulP family sulfate permease
MLGVYAGMAPVAASALTTGSVLMISTLTSAIALTTKDVLDSADLTTNVQAVFTLTLVAGLVMVALGLLKLGKLVNYVSNSVMTGFVMGVALLITVGKFDDIFGYKPTGVSNKVVEALDILVHPGEWEPATVAVGLGTIIGVFLLKSFGPTRRVALVIGVALGTAVVWIFSIDTELISDVASIPSGLDALPIPRGSSDLPDLSLVPELFAGSLAIALVALAQGAGVRPAFPNPQGPEASASRDFFGQGVGNVVGSVFQSPGAGGSLSRTAVAAEAGASSRWAGVMAAIWLVLLVVLFAPVVGHIPEAVVGGLLFVIGVEIIVGRLPDARLAWRTGRRPACFLVAAFVLSLVVPLQWAIIGGAVLSLLDFVGSSGSRARFLLCTRDGTGWVVSVEEPPKTVPAGEVLVLAYEGPNFFAEVPVLLDSTPAPPPDGAPGVVVLNLGLLTSFSSTFLKALAHYHRTLTGAGCGLVVCGVDETGLRILDTTGLRDQLGEENVVPLRYHIGENLDAGRARGEELLAALIPS